MQGVSFRYHTHYVAQGLGLTGWVRNLPDGRVEVPAEGEDEPENGLIPVDDFKQAFGTVSLPGEGDYRALGSAPAIGCEWQLPDVAGQKREVLI